jgi:hypothetical protein
MAAFLLRLPADMIDHIISQDFKDCTKMAEYADKLYSRRRGNTVAAVHANYEATINAVSGGHRRETSPPDRRRERRSPSRPWRSRRKTPGPYKDDSDICYYHTTYGHQEVQARVPVDPGKRRSRRELNTLGGGMIFLQDDECKQQFMVDTGAVCSVLPHRSKMPPRTSSSSSASGRPLRTARPPNRLNL